mmetsp:Transcript_5408/g.18154  ORF Transcript_5408/g.18154 Transcript_5408/m.18154 type:complete len:304 (+) Transcript_5408:26-937(+)
MYFSRNSCARTCERRPGLCPGSLSLAPPTPLRLSVLRDGIDDRTAHSGDARLDQRRVGVHGVPLEADRVAHAPLKLLARLEGEGHRRDREARRLLVALLRHDDVAQRRVLPPCSRRLKLLAPRLRRRTLPLQLAFADARPQTRPIAPAREGLLLLHAGFRLDDAPLLRLELGRDRALRESGLDECPLAGARQQKGGAVDQLVPAVAEVSLRVRRLLGSTVRLARHGATPALARSPLLALARRRSLRPSLALLVWPCNADRRRRGQRGSGHTARKMVRLRARQQRVASGRNDVGHCPTAARLRL